MWLQPSRYRQQVTGLTVNSFPNVTRKYTNQIRAMLHAWEKYGLELAEKEFFGKYDRKHRRIIGPPGTFIQIIKGKLDFLRSVRGAGNPQYLKLCENLAKIYPVFMKTYERIEHFAKGESMGKSIDDNVLVLDSRYNQGTGFILDGVGLITCQHVLGEDLNVYKATCPENKYEVKILKEDHSLDIAVLKLEGRKPFSCLHKGESEKLKRGDSIRVVGFPDYAPGQTIHDYPGVIVGEKKIFGKKRFNVSAQIYKGNSGGPVLNTEGKVIGIAVTGEDRPGTKPPKEEYGVIPIELIDDLFKNETKS